MKKLVILGVTILAVFLGGCSGGLGSPESAAKTYFNAFESEDRDQVKDALCEELKDESSMLPPEDSDDLDYHIEADLQFHEKEKDDDKAVIQAFGHMNIRLTTDEFDYEVKLSSRGDNPLVEIDMRKEGDDWKICSEFDLAAPAFGN